MCACACACACVRCCCSFRMCVYFVFTPLDRWCLSFFSSWREDAHATDARSSKRNSASARAHKKPTRCACVACVRYFWKHMHRHARTHARPRVITHVLRAAAAAAANTQNISRIGSRRAAPKNYFCRRGGGRLGWRRGVRPVRARSGGRSKNWRSSVRTLKERRNRCRCAVFVEVVVCTSIKIATGFERLVFGRVNK